MNHQTVNAPSDSGFMELPEAFLHAVMMLKNPFSSKYMIRTCQMTDYSWNLARNSRHETSQNITAGDENRMEVGKISRDLTCESKICEYGVKRLVMDIGNTIPDQHA